jgi:hypothetical protein
VGWVFDFFVIPASSRYLKNRNERIASSGYLKLFKKQTTTGSGYLKKKNQRTGFGYFENFKEPLGFIKELANNRWFSRWLISFFKKLGTVIIYKNWVFDLFIIMVIIFDTWPNTPSGDLVQIVIRVALWFFQFCDVAKIGNHPQKYLANSGYKPNLKF